jgi:hypothetical protein
MWKKTLSFIVRMALVTAVAAASTAFGAAEAGATSEGAASTGSGSPDSTASASDSTWEQDPSAWKVAIYPVYLWLPIFGAHIDVPPLPSNPGASSGTASGSFNGAGFAAFEILKSGWSMDGAFLMASITGDNTNPNVNVGMHIKYGQGMGGHEILKGLSLEGGVRRIAFKINATVGSYPEVRREPGVWDPLVGLTWRHQLGQKWMFRAHVDGGGFGVGSDVTLAGSVRADWRFAKHFGLAFGASALHFDISDTVADPAGVQRTLVVRQTLWGPVLGFGIYF